MQSKVAKEVLFEQVKLIRSAQFRIHQEIYESGVRIPIHFAFGHEAIAIGVAVNIGNQDKLLLPHRNIHYHLALGAKVEDLKLEYLLKSSEISGKGLGSMNLDFPSRGAVYTSNILGNNLSVATGIAMGMKVKKLEAVTWCVTGDGAIEEGSFFESLLLSTSKRLSVVYVIENNRWSLASEIQDRRRDIELGSIARGLGVQYRLLTGNNVVEYVNQLDQFRKESIEFMQPYIVEVDLKTLGGYFVTEEGSERYVNYHAGRVHQEALVEDVIENSIADPVWVTKNVLSSAISMRD